MRRSTEHLERVLPDPDLWDAPVRLIENDLYLQDGLIARSWLAEADDEGGEP
ncbi:hypothetical protein ACIQC9_09265 [Brevundimonas sp. NPDC092305]|uniref:hypothetical protein n=1 Tax=Brevundimonas sp. NPDC092305 TaxID=3363957 RepID=UPI0037F585A4